MKPFDPTKPCQTRDGRKVRILCTDSKFVWNGIPQTIVAEVGEHHSAWHYCLDGVFDPNISEGPNDLINIPEKRKLTGFINAYPSGFSGVHLTIKDANYAASFSSSRLACLDLSKYNIEFEEGEGL